MFSILYLASVVRHAGELCELAEVLLLAADLVAAALAGAALREVAVDAVLHLLPGEKQNSNVNMSRAVTFVGSQTFAFFLK